MIDTVILIILNSYIFSWSDVIIIIIIKKLFSWIIKTLMRIMVSNNEEQYFSRTCIEARPVEISLLAAVCNCSIPKSDHVYLRHLSTEYRSILSADMSADTRSIYRPTVGRHACRATPSDTSPLLGRHSADTLPTLDQHYAHLVSSCY